MTENSATEDKTWRVRILDLAGGAEEGISEEVGGFHDLAHANAFARCYVRDSIERCRTAGASAREVLDAWLCFGEDAIVVDAGDDAWLSANELDDFTATPASFMERDWRMLDPRRLVDEEEEDFSAYADTDNEDSATTHH